ncbi:hypothetical protein C9374_011820 [Naegleria lovaniensis]|uniref:Jacalin-type lectin domain-containing protein n=1 Tax=Naegleria lovaniensis TaxID=51637 RepID=A0AA88KF31_NAELO|nr:uncharacterized protein C9374_011820 [Naegleria lovaniensis]KAG2373731.1 hypothetical protein C9374_011820 [Naegleria lovaniensis]
MSNPSPTPPPPNSGVSRRSLSTISAPSSNSSSGGFGAFLKSFMGTSVHEGSTNSLLEGEDLRSLNIATTTSDQKSPSSGGAMRKSSIMASSNSSNSLSGGNNSATDGPVNIPLESLEEHVDYLFENYPETMRRYSEDQFMSMISRFTQVPKESPSATTSTTSSNSLKKNQELVPLSDEQKQVYFNKFIKFKYGNLEKLQSGEYSTNGYIFKRIVSPFLKIRKIAIRWGIYIDYIGIYYSNNTLKAYGNPTGGTDGADIYLSENEFIVKVSGLQREALIQVKFETNTGKVFGPFGSHNNITGAVPFMSSGPFLKDMFVSEGKVGPTIFVKFLVVTGVCPEWSGSPSFQKGISECWSELAHIHETVETLAKKSCNTTTFNQSPNNSIVLESSNVQTDSIHSPTEEVTDHTSLTSSSFNNSHPTVADDSSKTSIGDIYQDDIMDLRRSLAKCYELLQKVHSNAEIQASTFNEKLYKSFHNLFTNTSSQPSSSSLSSPNDHH